MILKYIILSNIITGYSDLLEVYLIKGKAKP